MELGLSLSPEQPSDSEEPWRLLQGHTNTNTRKPTKETVLSNRYSKRVKVNLVTLWSTVAFLAGVSLLFFSFCCSVRRIHSGGTVRKLADHDAGEESSVGGNPHFLEDEWIPLEADELAALCAQLGEWEPSPAPHSDSTPSTSTPEVASTSSRHGEEYILQSMLTPSNVSGVSSSEQQQHSVGFKHYRGKRISKEDVDALGQVPNKFGRRAYDGALDTGAEVRSSPVQQLGKTAQQTAATFTDFRLLGHQEAPIAFIHQREPASSVTGRDGAQQVQLATPPVLRPSPTSPSERSLVPFAGNAIPNVEFISDSIRAPASQSVLVPGGQSGSLALAESPPQRPNETSTRLARIRILVRPESPSTSSDKHPFVRMPTLLPHVRIADIDDSIQDGRITDVPISTTLRHVRNLFQGRAIGLAEANEVVRAAIKLARRALSYMTTSLDKLSASGAVDALGRRFLVFDAFHKVLKLTGNSKPRLRRLWLALVTRVPTMYDPLPRGMSNERHKFLHDLARQLCAALALYKTGSSPSDAEILDIKRKLFCMELSPKGFLQQSWDIWRLDDTNFTGSS
ncbi:uncharacterized protein EMH_0022180 [Eimeria mitis]|uniref:Transmembrane protein n=1 Tax=Eimeria mitis TaxID=44415 RepID=U6K9S5_9EIME|nr:uncharacterized protein EMH_0022180 [Eimeria mitis]CDJ34785.1 hypothetical protein EMH_0022180 [Eimeria mitis]